MGYIRHHAIIVTSLDRARLATARKNAVDCFKGIAPVSPITPEAANGYVSFLIGPDGSKERWERSDEGDRARDQYVSWLKKQRHQDGSSQHSWVVVQYGDEEGETIICADSEEELRNEEE